MNQATNPSVNTKDLSLDLIALFLQQCNEKKQQQAQETFELLYPIIHNEEMLALLTSLLEGAQLQAVDNRTFYTGAISHLTQQHQEAIVNYSKQVAAEFSQPQPLLLVNMIDLQGTPPFAIRICNGAGALYLPSDGLSANEIVHEITHCIVATGHHFFDEALAYYSEKKITNEPLPTQNLPSIDYCLQVKNIDQLNGLSREEVNNIYATGTLMIEHMLKHVSAAQLINFYERIPLFLATNKIEQQLTTLLGEQWRSLTHLPATENAAQASTDNASTDNNKIEALVSELNQAYFSGQLTQIETPLNQLTALNDGDSLEILMATIRGVFSKICYEETQDPALQLRLFALCDRVKSDYPATEASYVAGILALCIKISQASSYLEIQEISSEIGELFNQGLAEYPLNGELHLMKGKSLFDMPEAQGGNKTLAHVHFKQAKQDPLHGEHISLLVANYYN